MARFFAPKIFFTSCKARFELTPTALSSSRAPSIYFLDLTLSISCDRRSARAIDSSYWKRSSGML